RPLHLARTEIDAAQALGFRGTVSFSVDSIKESIDQDRRCKVRVEVVVLPNQARLATSELDQSAALPIVGGNECLIPRNHGVSEIEAVIRLPRLPPQLLAVGRIDAN